MRVHISEVEIGDQVLDSVFNQYGLHVMSKERILDADDISRLFRHNIEYIDIRRRTYNTESAPKDAKITRIIEDVQPRYDEAVLGIQIFFQQAIREGKIDEQEVKRTFHALVDSIRHEKDIISLLLTLNGKDDYTFHHSVQVGMISYYLAKWMRFSEQDALLAGKAGYLHDIGKSMVEASLLQKPSKLNVTEFETVKRHTVLGHEIIRNSQLPKEVALAVLQHHERIDGTGYPYGISGKDIHLLSKIVAVADVYSAMISARIYQKKRDPLIVLKEVSRLGFSQLDPQITHTFVSNMLPNFIGKKIALKSGEIGYIVMTNPTDFFRPLIQVNDRFIDLARQTQLEIETIFL